MYFLEKRPGLYSNSGGWGLSGKAGNIPDGMGFRLKALLKGKGLGLNPL